MSLGHSPSIIRDGLVFYYDMGNPQKSWKGKPTTNLVVGPDYAPVTSIDIPIDAKSARITGYASYDTGYGVYNRSVTSTASTGKTFTYSIWMRSPTGNSTYLMYVYDGTGSDGGWWDFGSGSLTTEWQRFTGTRSDMTGTVTQIRVYRLNQTGTIDLCAPQFEESSFATPFVDGTRSNTQAIVDLTGQNTITANSLTYNSDGTFEFDGSTSYVDLGQVFRYQGNFSIEAICKFTSLPNNASVCAARHPIVYNHDYGYNLMINASGNALWQIYNTSSATSISVSSNSVIGNDYVHLVGIKNGTTITLYVNGVAQTSGTLSSNEVYYTSSPFVIGGYGICGGTRFYSDGKIDKVAVYEKALTAAEVQQNFNALRGRYGI